MLKNYEYLEFETVREDWNEYRIEDGSLLRIKFVMIKILRREIPGGYDFRFNSNTIIGIHSPEIREPTNERYTPEELSKSIVKTDMKYQPLDKKEIWNKYVIKKDNSEIMVKIVITNIIKTNKYDEYGDPIYQIQTQPIFKMNPPKK